MLDSNFTQYKLNDNSLTITAKPSALVPRVLMFFFAFLAFIAPILALISAAMSGNGLHFRNLISFVVFALIGFYLLRIALWNTYGKESITIEENQLNYVADYRWFKDKVKELPVKGISLYVHPVGYEEDNQGVLLIQNLHKTIKCASKMPIEEIELLMSEMKTELLN